MIYLAGTGHDIAPFTAPLAYESHEHHGDRGPTSRWAAANMPNRYCLTCHGVTVYQIEGIDRTTRVAAAFNDLVRWGMIPDGSVVDLWQLAERLKADRGWAIPKQPADAKPTFPPEGFRFEPYKD